MERVILNTHCEETIKIAYPLSVEKILGVWKPGISENTCASPSHLTAGVGGIFSSTGGSKRAISSSEYVLSSTSWYIQGYTKLISLLWNFDLLPV